MRWGRVTHFEVLEADGVEFAEGKREAYDASVAPEATDSRSEKARGIT